MGQTSLGAEGNSMMTETLELRLQPNEKAAFKDAAKLAGLALSAWVRVQLRKAAIREFEEAGKRLDLSASGVD
jgi:uncharacterized protein (DUF1778 family)